MTCDKCPVSLQCLRGEGDPWACTTCTRMLLHFIPGEDEAAYKKMDTVWRYYLVDCPADGPARINTVDGHTEYNYHTVRRKGICPLCGSNMWYILSHDVYWATRNRSDARNNVEKIIVYDLDADKEMCF